MQNACPIVKCKMTSMFLDRMVMAYTAWVALLVVVSRENVPEWRAILLFHAVVLAVMTALSIWAPRGASWESPPPGEAVGKRSLRGGLRFFRYTYPLLLMVFYFEEVQWTVNAFWPHARYWFESHLYAADRFLFGDLPSKLLNPSVGIVTNELMHAFYFSYYFIVVGGVVFAWIGRGSGKPGPAFETTISSVVAAFLLCFIWYPFLPARGPWENPRVDGDAHADRGPALRSSRRGASRPVERSRVDVFRALTSPRAGPPFSVSPVFIRGWLWFWERSPPGSASRASTRAITTASTFPRAFSPRSRDSLSGASQPGRNPSAESCEDSSHWITDARDPDHLEKCLK